MMINKKILYLLLILFYFDFIGVLATDISNTIVFERIENKSIKDTNNKSGTTDKPTENNKKTVEIINDNITQKKNQQDSADTTTAEPIIFKPTEDGYYKDFETFTTTKNNLNVLRKALLRYAKSNSAISNKRNKRNDRDISEDEGEEEQEDKEYNKDIGNVYLKTVLYLSKSNWSIWINDKKITNVNNNDEENEFYVTKVNESQVDFIWRMFRSKFKIVNSNDKITEDMYRENEDTNKIEIKLSLSPNQTFVASENKVIDGKYSEDKFILDREMKQQQKQVQQEIVEEEINFDELMKNL